VVEVGYSIMSDYQGLGFASEATAALTGWAFSYPEVQLVTAETLPTLLSSIRLLEKTGFHLLGEGSERGVIRYGRKRV
jgi:RimJ/RimL family protein N-acetyltransferase